MKDSRFLFYQADDSGKRILMRLDTETGETTRIAEGHQSWSSVLTRDGKTLMFSKENELMALDTQTGADRQVASFPQGVWARSFVLSPDEHTLAYVAQHQKEDNCQLSIAGCSLELLDLGTGQSREIERYGKDQISEAPGFFRRPLVFTPDGKYLLTGHEGGRPNYIHLIPLNGGGRK